LRNKVERVYLKGPEEDVKRLLRHVRASLVGKQELPPRCPAIDSTVDSTESHHPS
jgi:hypothetical protein